MSAHVFVKLEVEVTVGSWNEGASFSSLRDQVGREAVQKLNAALRNSPDCRVLGVPLTARIVLDGKAGGAA